jgi:tRNA (guanine37-N1)-methyltransferase
MSPSGKTFNQEKAYTLSSEGHIILLCGHYEGFDERIKTIIDEEISIGNFVLTGGEIPAMVLIDSVARYIDGVITGESTSEESFSGGLLEYPQYTRPEEFEGMKVPEVLQSGHHENINKWRRREAIKVTYNKRPDLLKKVNLTDEEKKLIEELENKE